MQLWNLLPCLFPKPDAPTQELEGACVWELEIFDWEVGEDLRWKRMNLVPNNPCHHFFDVFFPGIKSSQSYSGPHLFILQSTAFLKWYLRRLSTQGLQFGCAIWKNHTSANPHPKHCRGQNKNDLIIILNGHQWSTAFIRFRDMNEIHQDLLIPYMYQMPCKGFMPRGFHFGLSIFVHPIKIWSIILNLWVPFALIPLEWINAFIGHQVKLRERKDVRGIKCVQLFWVYHFLAHTNSYHK